ncbi:hypothetical protein HK102_012900, partial [Quaeritorhiza haematococci]
METETEDRETQVQPGPEIRLLVAGTAGTNGTKGTARNKHRRSSGSASGNGSPLVYFEPPDPVEQQAKLIEGIRQSLKQQQYLYDYQRFLDDHPAPPDFIPPRVDTMIMQ